MRFLISPYIALVIAAQSAAADEPFTPLFNGKDFSGWINVNCSPGTWSVRDGTIVCTGKPTGLLRTDKQYENFILELEWKHLHKGGNSGLFVYSDPLPAVGTPFARALEIQVMNGDDPQGRYTGHGDVFSIHGAKFKPDRPHPGGWERCLPSEKRAKPPGEWNHYRVESRDGRVTLAVNGKIVSGGSNRTPRKGYLCLESEGSEVHFRNIRIAELPSNNPPASEVAHVAEGTFQPLYTGVDLAGWKADAGHEGHWRPRNWTLDYDGRSEAKDKNLWSAKEYDDFQLIVDWRLPRKPVKMTHPVLLPSGDYATNVDGLRKMVEMSDAGDSGIYLRGDSKSQVNIFCWPCGSGEVWGYREDKSLPPEVRAACTPKARADKPPGQWNRFFITMKGDRLTVALNDQTVIENAQLPNVPRRGPIAPQHHNDPVQFANVLVRELK